jgi:hypothetical protein
MAETNIPPMKTPVHTLPRVDAHREQRMARVIQAPRRLSSPRGGGRAWINGKEVGGPDTRYAHLSVVYD